MIPGSLNTAMLSSEQRFNYQNEQAALWASKLSTPLSDSVAAAYDQLFNDVGDIITARLDSFGIMATETQEAAIKNLVFDAPDLTLINPEVLSWKQFHGFAQVAFAPTTHIAELIPWAAGTGYTYANVTITAPTGTAEGKRAATATAIIEDGGIVGYTLNDPGFGYPLAWNGAQPTVTITGDGTGALCGCPLYMGRIHTGIFAADPNLKFKPATSSIAIGSTEYTGNRGASLGSFRPHGSLPARSFNRVSLGTTINTWTGGSLNGSADIGVYSGANTGHYVFNRSNTPTAIDRYFNGNKLSSPTLALNSSPNEFTPFAFFGQHLYHAWLNTSRHSWFWIGDALTGEEILRMYYAINKMFSGFGVETPAVVPFSTSMIVS